MDKHETLINPLLNAIAKRETQDIPLTLPVRDPNSETDFSVRP
jgi:hypothetical protein